MAGKKKAKSAEHKAQKAAKQSKKTAKGEKKTKAKVAAVNDDSDADDVDLDAVLAAYAEEQAKFLKITETACGPPSARSSSTLVASPSNRNELFIFGGEYHDGSSASFYNDLFVYQIDKGEWRQVVSGNTPLPRSGHACCRGGNTGGIYICGGEFSSPKQNQFYHYHDFWHLDPDTREWTKIEPKGKGKNPPARSGHRMTYFKNYIILFGGFQDTSQQTKYLNDTWIFDCKENVWHEMKLAPAAQKPDPRSSFSLLPHESGAVLCGGYSRVKATANTNKQGKGGAAAAGAAVRNILKPMVHQDTWFLRINIPPPESPSGTPPTIRWERRKRPANTPNPPRAGATMAYHKGRGVMFGGVHDVEDSEEGIDSEFFNELYIWNIDRNRFFPLTLRRPKQGAAGGGGAGGGSKKQSQAGGRARDRGKADEEELLRNLAALQTKGSISAADEIQLDRDAGDEQRQVEEDEPSKRELIVRFEMPHNRFNAQLTVQDDVLYIYGGTLEKRDIEITFTDLYSIDLGKLDGVREQFYIEPINWNVTTTQDSDEEMDDDDDDDDDDDEDEDNSDEDMDEKDAINSDKMYVDTPPSSVAGSTTAAAGASAMVVETEPETSAKQDSRPFPRAFESLREFYARTSEDWQRLVMETPIAARSGGVGLSSGADQSVKEIRKMAFDMAEERWWDCREEVRVLEDEQEAAGIGEVVNMADRGEAAGGAGTAGGGGGGGGGRRR
ncbi:hypothetical protein PV10_02823 [Exophiala mesophila]|uniref:DUF4110 domain-containing protein n=1 Tax=Exophiala mesophila TaxID=212818 RepID=A0A0D2A844_EXOME|nr:uncharacterized protein PV10_02823 [Exophiala mesophila]KIV95138.1 hypothetical protein PV10_02823 [Exophiala mesophila]